jgi:hypothetical protein
MARFDWVAGWIAPSQDQTLPESGFLGVLRPRKGIVG